MSAATANTLRRLQDAGHTKTKALPAANASNATASIDLGTAALGPAADNLEFEISIPATPSLVDAKTITLQVEDSADDASFAAIPSLATLVVTGAGGAGAAAASRRYRLPNTTRRYVRVSAAVLAAGGDNTAVSYTQKLFANK